jgi:hypothetical protein
MTGRWPTLWVLPLMVACFAPAAFADLLSDFQQQYPQASAHLQEAYKQAHVTGRVTYRDGQGKLLETQWMDVARDGDYLRSIRIIVSAAGPNIVTGTILVGGGTSNSYFAMHRKAGQPDFQYTSSGPSRNFSTLLTGAYQPLVRAFATANGTVLDNINRKVLTATAADPFPADGPDAVEVTATFNVQAREQVWHFVFIKPTWALVEWFNNAPLRRTGTGGAGATTMPVIGPVSLGKVTYSDTSFPPKIKSCDEWFETPRSPGARINEVLFEADSVAFVSTAQDKFAPAAVVAEAEAEARLILPEQGNPGGVPQPPGTQSPATQAATPVETPNAVRPRASDAGDGFPGVPATSVEDVHSVQRSALATALTTGGLGVLLTIISGACWGRRKSAGGE